MSKINPVNLGASIRQKLMNLAQQRDEDFQQVLTRYALERLAYRLSKSKHVDFLVFEKLEAMVKLDAANSRMKDFYNLLTLAGRFSFESALLCKAIEATFERRQTAFPSSEPLALTKKFAVTKQKLWEGFLKRSKLENTEADFSIVVQTIYAFLRKPMEAIIKRETFKQTWLPGGSWK